MMPNKIRWNDNVSFFDRIISFMPSFTHALILKRAVRNWPSIIKLVIAPNSGITLAFNDGKTVEIKNLRAFFDFWYSEQGQMELLKVEGFANRVKVDRARQIVYVRFADRTVRFHYKGNLFAETLAWIRTAFFEQQYGWLDVKGRNVVDIGASVGDTAIYFALKGARHVYGFELDRERCALAHENVRLNNLSKKIDIINAGCGSPGKIASDSDKKSRFYSLLQIAEMYGLKDAALKMDCEGCEYPILLNSSKSTVRMFVQIMLEYHYGYKNIAKRLIEYGFNVRYTRPESSKSGNVKSYLGYMYARRMKI